MKVLNLIREFELQKMKESETVKEYSDRLLSIVNKIRLFDTKFKDSRIVEKTLAIVPERYEVQEQRRLMRQDGMVEGASAANHKTQSKAVICKNKYQEDEADAQVTKEEEEDH
ncbi:uncharacterized protein LOC124896916 [Capsicum annuum]|uniref:uncharacterized protein LOC124896916 n=1 Tax=Capsicum annuum TaxID=4072 RepID=UPI001FB169FB|nr:uncharacterized protein LOC124896916 [Capsicum annuum]